MLYFLRFPVCNVVSASCVRGQPRGTGQNPDTLNAHFLHSVLFYSTCCCSLAKGVGSEGSTGGVMRFHMLDILVDNGGPHPLHLEQEKCDKIKLLDYISFMHSTGTIRSNTSRCNGNQHRLT